ncbi:MAG TPA: nucleoside-diphosphate kinase [Candidatus Acidoferrales bacterium]|nr:nucleoside-diphosphate kinase [Candidatus Acidoferrales bacterium]
MIDRTLVIIKPDGVYRSLTGKIITTLEDTGLKLIATKMVNPTVELTGKHYAPDEKWLQAVGEKATASYKEKGIDVTESPREIGMRIRQHLLDYFTSGPVVAMVFEGNEAVFVTRKVLGPTEPRKADPSTIRGKYSSDSYDLADKNKRAVKNLVHMSEDKEIAEKEIALWFGKEELVSYKSTDEEVMYK